jgi:hypothetical protein
MSQLGAEFRSLREGDAQELAANLRDADRREIAALGHSDASTAVRDSIAASIRLVVVADPEGVVAIMGVAPLSDNILAPVGAPWLLGTKRSALHTRTLVKHGPAYTRAMLDVYPRLMNMVHAENSLHISWLKRVGFRFRLGAVRMPTGADFLLFEMGR